MTTILGLSTSPHDSSAALIKDGEVVCAIEEERLTRIRHCIEYDNSKYTLEEEAEYFDSHFLEPSQNVVLQKIRAFQAYFKEAGYDVDDINSPDLVIGSNLLLTKIPVETYHDVNHHMAHASHAFYTSPYEEAAILVIDGSGDPVEGGLETVSIYEGSGSDITLREKITGTIAHETNTIIALSNSIGVLYQNASVLCGYGTFGEGTLMGLASFGKPSYSEVYAQHCIQKENRYEIDNLGLYQYIKDQIEREQGGEEFKADVAASIQKVADDLIYYYAQRAREITGCDNLCYAGGVALNATTNTKILNSSTFARIYIPSAPGDGGTSIGAALYGYHNMLGNERQVSDAIPCVYMGRSYSDAEIDAAIGRVSGDLEVQKLSKSDMIERAAQLLHDGAIIGWFQDASEFGPRALGNRSILASPTDVKNRDRLNVIKHRQSFRPVAPVMPYEFVERFFSLPHDSTADSLAYMLFTLRPRSAEIAMSIPAVIHADNTARVQTVTKKQNPKLYQLLEIFGGRSELPVLINTSFNTKGESMVETPDEAIKTFIMTDIDYLIIGNYCITKHGT